MTLREAIDQAISLGERDPLRIAEKIRSRYDSKWLAKELLEIASDVLANEARRVLGSQRRSSLAIAQVNRIGRKELMLRAAWLPGVGWVEFGKFKPEDFDHLAATYRKGAAALNRHADWCDSAAALMREQNVAQFCEVSGDLPALSPAEEAA